MAFEHGGGFRACGSVVRKFSAPSGKFASLVLSVPGDRGDSKVDFVTFDHDVINALAQATVGAVVQVTGKLSMNKLTSKNREVVKIDGYEKWVPQLVIKKIEVAPSSKKPGTTGHPSGDSDVNW